MATTYLSPGVYVEEIDAGIKPIQGAGTSMAAFIGITAQASIKETDADTGEPVITEQRLNKPTLVTNWTQFTKIFGGFVPGAYLPDAVYAYYNNGGGPAYVVSIRATEEEEGAATYASASIPSSGKGKDSFTATAAAAGTIGNSITVVIETDVDDKDKPTGTFSMTVGEETKAGLTMKKETNFVGDVSFAGIVLGEFGTAAPADGRYTLTGGGIKPLGAPDFIGDVAARTGIGGLEALDDVRILSCPDIYFGYDGSTESKKRVQSVQQAMIDHCEKMRYCFTVLDTPPGLNAQQAREWRYFVNYDSTYAAMYYPWVEVADLAAGGTKMVPPSGHVVGLYNRVDADRGVHKAPANEILAGVVGLELQLTRGEQDVLNPIGVNCIRTFPGRGIRVWGARTLSSDGAWRYINVRRLFIYIEASMDAGLQWVVFEPNDMDLWARISRDVTVFLRGVWRSGALFGASDSDAYYVKCDAELNSIEIREAGQVIIEVGVSPVKPAEFVIFRISQWAGADAV
jgi:phage tail sheath protein FI